MASIGKDPGGRKRILFVAGDGTRKTIRLGKMSQRDAESVRFRVEQLIAAKISGNAIDADTARWVAALEPILADRLARVGLVEPREPAEPPRIITLGPAITEYIDGRDDLKPASKVVWGHVQRNLIACYGEARDVCKITPGDADDFRLFLVREGLAPTTIHKRLQFARTFFRNQLRRKLIAENPFADVKAPASQRADRQRFVTAEEADRLIDACPNHHWRTIVALARYGGLRCPSEVLSLRWQDIDREHDRIVVQSPKTEHHPGKESRTIPMFPKLRPHLQESFDLAEDGAVYVVDERMRKGAQGKRGWQNCNLRTTFKKIVQRAGLKPWPRLFHNLRSSRQTELAERFPSHVVCAWLGNSEDIARKHYYQVTAGHFKQAVDNASDEPEPKAAQNPAQQAHETPRKVSQPLQATDVETPDYKGLRQSASNCPSTVWRIGDSNP